MTLQVGKDVPSMLDSKQLAKCLADSKVELQKYQSTCRELEDRISALDADNCQLNAQLAVSKDQLDRIQHQLFEDREVCPAYSVCDSFVQLWLLIEYL